MYDKLVIIVCWSVVVFVLAWILGCCMGPRR